MMKLFLIRHSKAEDRANSDFERRLTPDGKNLVRKVSGNLKVIPGNHAVFISSPAFRAIETANEFSKYVGMNAETIRKDEFLYLYHTPERFLMWLDSLDTHIELWIFGHNPMLSEIVTFLTGKQIYSMPKCAVACFETNQKSWFDADHTNTKLLFFESPKNHT